MKISFDQVGTKRTVSRYLLRFRSPEGYQAALARSEKDGFIRFHNGNESNLIGRVVRVSPQNCLIEVDAAVDTEPEV